MCYELEILSMCFTALGVGVLGIQIYLMRRQVQTQFEDSMSEEYRALIKEIPANVLMGHEKADEDKIAEYIYNYLDLSNYQVFLRMNGRIGKKTWKFWRDGIQDNLKLPVFEEVWEKVKSDSPNCFYELTKLEKDFSKDPKKWKWCSI